MALMPIPDDWDGETWRCWAVEWPDSVAWNAMLRGFITMPTVGRFWDERTGSVIAAQAVGIEIWNRNSPLEESLMSCNEDTQAALALIAEKLQGLIDKACCPTGSPGSGILNSGSRGAGISQQPPNSYLEDLGTEIPPTGFDTWAQYRQHKCNAANDIVLQHKIDLLSLSNLVPGESTFTGILTVLVGVLLTPVPYDDLAYIIGLLTVAAFEYSLMAELSSGVQDDAENLICTLYSSSDAETAQANFRNEIDGLIAEVTAVELAQEWLHDLVIGLTPMDVFNRLFVNLATTTQGADCSACEPPPPVAYEVILGTETSSNPSNPIIITAAEEHGYSCDPSWGFTVNFTVPVEIVSAVFERTSDYPFCSGGNAFFFYSNEDYTDLILATNSFPQDIIGGMHDVRCIYIVFDNEPDMEVLTLSYVEEP